MAKQVKIQIDGATVYPQTSSDAIADLARKKVLSKVVDTIEDDAELQRQVTVTKETGNVPVGAVYAKDTAVSTVIADILAYLRPEFQRLEVGNDTVTYRQDTNMFCSSTAISLMTLKHGETNIDNIKGGVVTLNLNGTETEKTAAASSNVEISSVFDISCNKAQFYVALSGTNSLGAAMTQRKVTLTAYMPVFCFVSATQEESEISGNLVAATAESIVYVGGEAIDKTCTIANGGAWCVALPSHMAMTGIGTKDDFDFGTQRTTTTTFSLSREVNGIADVPYTVYLLPMGTAQENLEVRITTKAV
jgi:hypothetical protein